MEVSREDQADNKQHQWHQRRGQSEWTEAWDSHKLQISGLSYNWWEFQAWDTLQDSTDNSSIDKAGTSLDWQEYFSQLQDTTDALPCHIHLPGCLWIMDHHSRAPKKKASNGNEVLPQDTTHLIQRPCYQRGSPCQDPAGNWTTRRPPDHHKETQTAVAWSCLLFFRSGKNYLARHGERGEMTKADRGRGGKTTSGNGQAWHSPSLRGQWRTGENGGNWFSKSSVVLQRPSWLRDRWRWWCVTEWEHSQHTSSSPLSLIAMGWMCTAKNTVSVFLVKPTLSCTGYLLCGSSRPTRTVAWLWVSSASSW